MKKQEDRTAIRAGDWVKVTQITLASGVYQDPNAEDQAAAAAYALGLKGAVGRVDAVRGAGDGFICTLTIMGLNTRLEGYEFLGLDLERIEPPGPAVKKANERILRVANERSDSMDDQDGEDFRESPPAYSVRDYTLDAAASACEAQTGLSPEDYAIARGCAAAVRHMKGDQGMPDAGILAWMNVDDDPPRVVTEVTMASARIDGGALLSSLQGYTLPLVALSSMMRTPGSIPETEIDAMATAAGGIADGETVSFEREALIRFVALVLGKN